jgi:GDPmannose 4,6-dehydratase
MLQQDKPDDFVIATGHQYSVRDFVEAAARELSMRLEWRGAGADEHALWEEKVVARVDQRYYRPAEVQSLLGDASKARAVLGWTPRTDFPALVREMAAHDLALAEGEAMLARSRAGGTGPRRAG